MTVQRVVVMYGRRACHLCDEARSIILAERGRLAFRFEEVLIDGDDALEAAYSLRIPVVEVDGEEAFEYVVDPIRLRRLLRMSPPA